ncbi:site-specific integrase [Vagococcus sp. JNUCC 83]
MSQRKYAVKKGKNKYRWEYVITRRDAHGKRCDISKGGFKTKKEARIAEYDRRKELENELLQTNDLVTINEIFEQLIDKKKHEGKREGTINTYVYPYDKWFREEIGSRTIRDVKKVELQKIIDDICPYVSSVDKQVSILKNIYNLAYQDEIVSRNIAEGIVIKKELLKESKKVSDVFLEKDEITPFFKSLSSYIECTDRFIYRREMLMYNLLLVTGLRSGEAIALKWTDIDLDKKIINVNKSQKKEGNVYVEGSTKTKESVRKIPVLNEELYRMFCKWKDEQQVLIKKRGLKVPEDLKELIFFDIGNMRRLPTAFYTQTLNSFYRKKPDIPVKIKSHGFRHTFTSLVREDEECAEKWVSLYLGHTKNKTMTDKYTHIDNTKDLVIVAEIINKKLQIIFGKSK